MTYEFTFRRNWTHGPDQRVFITAPTPPEAWAMFEALYKPRRFYCRTFERSPQ